MYLHFLNIMFRYNENPHFHLRIAFENCICPESDVVTRELSLDIVKGGGGRGSETVMDYKIQGRGLP